MSCRGQEKEIFSSFSISDEELEKEIRDTLKRIKKKGAFRLLTTTYLVDLYSRLEKIKRSKPKLAPLIRAYQKNIILELKRIERGEIKRGDVLATGVSLGLYFLEKFFKRR